MKKIHFIGGGQMVEAIIRALLANKKVLAADLSVSDIDPDREAYLHTTYSVKTGADNLTAAGLVVIGVRPQDDLIGVGQSIARDAPSQAVVVSIVAGVTLARLADLVGEARPIARVIPNTLTDTGFGYSGVALNAQARPEQVDDFLSGFGKVQYLEEKLIDAFTGFGVAGPNYIYYFVESMVDAGVLAGIPRPQAWQTVLENLVGAAAMLQKTGLHPRQLLDINNSPAGVGMHALYELNNSDFAAGLQRSVLAAVRRTTELGGK